MDMNVWRTIKDHPLVDARDVAAAILHAYEKPEGGRYICTSYMMRVEEFGGHVKLEQLSIL